MFGRKRITPICAYCGQKWPKVKTVGDGRAATLSHILQCKENPFIKTVSLQTKKLKQSNLILRSIARNHPEIIIVGSVRHDQIKKNEIAIAIAEAKEQEQE